MNFNKSYSIRKSELYPTDCLEHIKTLKLRTLTKKVVNFTEKFNSFITIGNLNRTPDGNITFNLDKQFEDCGTLKPNIRLKCKSESGAVRNITIQGLQIDTEDITGLQCWAMGYIDSSNVEDTFSQREWSECFTASGEACSNPVNPRDLIIGMSVGGSFLLLASVGVLSGIFMWRRRSVVVHTIKTDLSPSHIVIKKTENVNLDLDTAASLQVNKSGL